jgi:hypothetical protein
VKTNCVAHALIIAIAKITNDPDYTAYRKGRKIRQVVDNLIATTGINIHNGGGIPELEKFQDHFNQYKIAVNTGLNCDICLKGRSKCPNALTYNTMI